MLRVAGAGLVVAIFAAISACQAPSVAATDEHRERFPGEYRGSLADGLSASLTVTPSLQFTYRQDLGEATRLGKLTRKGRLKITGPHTARAGEVILVWRGKNTVTVRSPHGAGIRYDGISGGEPRLGATFILRRTRAGS